MSTLNLLTFLLGSISSGLVGILLMLGTRTWLKFSWRAAAAFGTVGFVLTYWAVLYVLVMADVLTATGYSAFARPALPVLAGAVYFAHSEATKVLKALLQKLVVLQNARSQSINH